MVLFVYKFYRLCNFRKFVNFGLGTARSERVKMPFGTTNCNNRIPTARVLTYFSLQAGTTALISFSYFSKSEIIDWFQFMLMFTSGLFFRDVMFTPSLKERQIQEPDNNITSRKKRSLLESSYLGLFSRVNLTWPFVRVNQRTVVEDP